MDGEGLMGAVSSVVDTVSNVVGGAIDLVKDAGSFIDDTVRDVVPGGWVTVGGAVLGASALGALESAAAAEGATGLASLPESVLSADAAFATGSELAAPAFVPSELATALSTSAPTTDYLGTQALGDATTGAVGSTATPSALGEFNAANVSKIGIQAPDLSTLGSLGGTAAMDVGTAGLTAEQLANANAAAQVGSNAQSGLGYLGGAESLPSGTAGITGVTAPSTVDWSKMLQSSSGQNMANALKSSAFLTPQLQTYRSQNPFTFTQQQPIQDTTNQLANLLKQG